MSKPTYFEVDKRVERLDLQTCVEHYQVSKNENLLKIILQKLSSTMNYIVYYKSKCPDKAELFALCEDILLRCLNCYDSGYGVKFITYYTNSMSNALKTKHNKTFSKPTELSLDYEYDNGKDNDENTMSYFMGKDEAGYDEVELNVLLAQIKTILKSRQRVEGQWEREYKVCELLLREPHSLTNAEIAREVKVTAAAIPNILANIQKKFAKSVSDKKLEFTL